MKASEFYEYLYGEKPPKNFQNSSSIHIFGFAEAYVEYLNQGQLLPIDSVSDSVDTGIDFSYRDENGEIQHNNVSTETAQALLRRWQEQEIKVNKFIKDYHKTN